MNKCVLCGRKDFEKLYLVRGRKIEKCKNCFLVRTNSDKFDNYANYHRDEAEYTKGEPIFRNIFVRRFKTISKFSSIGKILDIGSSTGTMLSIFQNNGWKVWGVEPSKSADIANKRGIKTTKGYFEKAKLPTNYFDVVVMNHTFEHVKDPVVILTKIKSVLKKGGIAYIDVPNFGSLDARLKGENWGYLMPEEHTFQYTPETLTAIFNKVGLEVIWTKTWSGIFDVGNPVQKFVYDLTHFRKAFFKDMIKIPFNIITTLANRGTSLAVIGKKG